jgi:hypothetical protein
MSDEVRFKREDIVAVLRDLETIVVSLDRIGAAAEQLGSREYERASSDFLDEWDVARKLIRARRVLSAAFSDEIGDDGMDELERELVGVPCWSISGRTPEPGDGSTR